MRDAVIRPGKPHGTPQPSTLSVRWYRSRNGDKQCLLVIVGVKLDGRKEWVVIDNGFRESTASWCEVLLDRQARALAAGPRLAVGDGAMGFWAALKHAHNNEPLAKLEPQTCG